LREEIVIGENATHDRSRLLAHISKPKPLQAKGSGSTTNPAAAGGGLAGWPDAGQEQTISVKVIIVVFVEILGFASLYSYTSLISCSIVRMALSPTRLRGTWV
jgi:hypothetical protein